MQFRYFVYFLIFFTSTFAKANVDVTSVSKEQIQNNQEAKNSQLTISQIDDQTTKITQEYREALKILENTKIYNEQLRKTIQDQKEEKISIRSQIREVKYTDKQIIPLMVEMIESLERFIQLDIPFLKEERDQRLKEINKIMTQSNVTTSEKYRRIAEAFQIENEYGRTTEVYRGLQNIKGKTLTVNFLRIGRLSLIYQTLDKKYQAYWSKTKKQWVTLPNRYRKAISLGIQMAQKQIAPNFVMAWIPNPSIRTIDLPAFEKLTPDNNHSRKATGHKR